MIAAADTQPVLDPVEWSDGWPLQIIRFPAQEPEPVQALAQEPAHP